MSNILGVLNRAREKERHRNDQGQIVEAFRNSEFNTEVVLFELLDLAYVVCSYR